MKPYWFKLIENDQPVPIQPKNHIFLTLLVGIVIGVMGTVFLVPSKVVDNPVTAPVVVTPTPITTNPQPSIKNPMLNPSGDEDDIDDDEEEDEDDD